MDDFAGSLISKVVKMRDFNVNGCKRRDAGVERNGGNLSAVNDLLMEKILDSISTTPIGQVLEKIASLPEVRRDKILDVRRRLAKGQYDLSERLDMALDKVLEDFTR